MAVRRSREFTTGVAPEAILDVLSNVEAFPSWSGIHRKVTVVDKYPDGRPHRASTVLKVMGIGGRQVIEFHWGPDWMVWDAIEGTRESAGHVEYNLMRLLDGTKVRVDITVEPTIPLPSFLMRWGSDKVMTSLADGLRRHISGRSPKFEA